MLADDPLLGRALIGQAVSLIKLDDSNAMGQELLSAISKNSSLLPADRAEARFLLGVQALSNGDEKGLTSGIDALADDLNASYFHTRLVELSKTRKLFDVAKSLADLNLEKGRAFLLQQRRQGVVPLKAACSTRSSRGNGRAACRRRS